MCTTNLSPTALTGSPVASCSIPELSIATCPCGSHSTRKISAASASISRWTSFRSCVMDPSSHPPPRPPGSGWLPVGGQRHRGRDQRGGVHPPDDLVHHDAHVGLADPQVP